MQFISAAAIYFELMAMVVLTAADCARIEHLLAGNLFAFVVIRRDSS